jgi:hypothetical protein
MYRSAFAMILTSCLVGVGCARSGPTSPTGATGPGQESATQPTTLELAGVWNWSETTEIKATAPAAAFFGLTPEGPITHIACTSSGELTVAQNGADFTGAATQSSLCRTQGGVVFDPFPLFPDAWTMGGTLTGRSISFTVETGGFPCHYRGSARVNGGTVEELRATGGCDVPKEIGHDKILGFVATRQ